MGRTGWFTPMASPIQGRLTLFRVRKTLGIRSLLKEFSASTCESLVCCCSCFRKQQRWGDSASLLSGHLQQCGGPTVQSHGFEALPLQRGDLAGQQAGATGRDQETDHAAGRSVGGKHLAFRFNNTRGRMVPYSIHAHVLCLLPGGAANTNEEESQC